MITTALPPPMRRPRETRRFATDGASRSATEMTALDVERFLLDEMYVNPAIRRS